MRKIDEWKNSGENEEGQLGLKQIIIHTNLTVYMTILHVLLFALNSIMPLENYKIMVSLNICYF